ncbi:MAG: HD domain-containing protein [Chloroflexi bacterium]|nr:HD domain-containing protein [Chloroflexota bacterium]
MSSVYDRLLELAQPYLDTRDNDLHVRTARQFAERLLEQIPADRDIVIPAILLHDLGWKMIPEELQATAYGPVIQDPELNRKHEVEGVRLARGILEQVNYDPVKTQEILTIIDGHDSRPVALSVNDQIVKDSDKLWRLSEKGFKLFQRTFGIPPMEFAEWLGAQVDRWFFTEPAKVIARQEIQKRKAEISRNGSKGA